MVSVLPIFRNKKKCELTYSSDIDVCFELIWQFLSLPFFLLFSFFPVAVVVQWELAALCLLSFG